jgi:ABC-2 type transport system permease protein
MAQNHATTSQTERLELMGQEDAIRSPVELRSQVWYNPDLVSAYFMVPGVIASILYAITSILTATTVVRERERGTIEQLIVTPIRSWEMIVGKLVPYILLAFINTLEVMALGSLLFKVPIRGSLALLMLLCGLFLMSGLGIGLLISTIANNQQEAMLLVYMTYLPTIFLSGFFFPLEAMPRFLQWVSLFLPMRYFLVIIRSVMLKGAGLLVMMNEVLALLAFAVVIMSLAALRFRKRLD